MSGFDCIIGHQCYGAVGYADDISQVAPSICALNKMCDICLEFAYDYYLQINLQNVNLLNMEVVPTAHFTLMAHK